MPKMLNHPWIHRQLKDFDLNPKMLFSASLFATEKPADKMPFWDAFWDARRVWSGFWKQQWWYAQTFCPCNYFINIGLGGWPQVYIFEIIEKTIFWDAKKANNNPAIIRGSLRVCTDFRTSGTSARLWVPTTFRNGIAAAIRFQVWNVLVVARSCWEAKAWTSRGCAGRKSSTDGLVLGSGLGANENSAMSTSAR